MDEVNAGSWASLRDRRTGLDWAIEPVDDDWTEGLLAVDLNGRLHLLVGVDTEPLVLPPDLQGIEVRVMESEGIWLDVSARSHHEDLFTMVVNKILNAIRVEGRDPALSVQASIDELRAALRPVGLELGVGEQIGLFGELWVLSNVLLPILGSRACHLWSGPMGERHDFVGAGVHLEVKTTTRRTPTGTSRDVPPRSCSITRREISFNSSGCRRPCRSRATRANGRRIPSGSSRPFGR
jgi:hypothetical protein